MIYDLLKQFITLFLTIMNDINDINNIVNDINGIVNDINGIVNDIMSHKKDNNIVNEIRQTALFISQAAYLLF